MDENVRRLIAAVTKPRPEARAEPEAKPAPFPGPERRGMPQGPRGRLPKGDRERRAVRDLVAGWPELFQPHAAELFEFRTPGDVDREFWGALVAWTEDGRPMAMDENDEPALVWSGREWEIP